MSKTDKSVPIEITPAPNKIILPRGTIVKFQGVPLHLLGDTLFYGNKENFEVDEWCTPEETIAHTIYGKDTVASGGVIKQSG